MGRNKNDGYGKFGGRQQGTPNKVSSELKDWIAQLLNDGKEQFLADLKELKPSERVRVYTGLLNYVLPKQQAITADIDSSAVHTPLQIIVNNQEEKELIKRAIREKGV